MISTAVSTPSRTGCLQRRQQRSTVQTGEAFRDRRLVEAGDVQQRRRQVDRRGECLGRTAAGQVGVTDRQRHVEVLVVDEVALLTKPCAPATTVIGGEDHHCPVRLPAGLQRIEHQVDAAVHVAHAVEVEADPAPPRVLIRHRAEHRLHGGGVSRTAGGAPARSSESVLGTSTSHTRR